MKKIVMTLIAGLFLVGTVSTASAAVLTLNPSFAPDISGGAIRTAGAFDYYVPDTSVTGTITQTVYQNATGLLFAFDIDNTSTSTVSRVTSLNTANFEGFTVSAGYMASLMTVAPSAAEIDGGTITFRWSTDSLSAGETSPTLYIQTNAPYLTEGSFSLQGTTIRPGQVGIQGFTGYSPTATPEPATLSLLGMGLLGLLGFRRKTEV
jgi:hypothetical protein